MVSFHRHHCWLFFCFLIANECDHSFGSLHTTELLCWAIILLPYTPPQEPSSGLVLCSGDDTVNGDLSCSDTAPISNLIAAGFPPIKNRRGSTIRRRHADSTCYFLVVVFGFLIAHECDHSFGSMLTSELLCWEIILLPYTPPPPSEAWFWTRTMQWRRHRQWRPILQQHRTYIQSYCRWLPTHQKSSRINNTAAPRW